MVSCAFAWSLEIVFDSYSEPDDDDDIDVLMDGLPLVFELHSTINQDVSNVI